MRFYDVG